MSELERLKMSVSDKILDIVELAIDSEATLCDVESVAIATAAVIIIEVRLAELKGELK